MKTGAPVYLYEKLTDAYPCDTRQARGSTIRQGPSYQTKLGLAKDSFRWRGASWYETIPVAIRNENKLPLFKKKLNTWVKANISI